MFKCASKKTLLVGLLSFFITLDLKAWAVVKNYDAYAIIENFVDEKYLTAITYTTDWEIGEIVPIISQKSRLGVIGYTEVVSLKPLNGPKKELKLRLIRQSRKYFIQQGDYIKHLNLETENPDYIGTTDLLVKKTKYEVSSKYKALFYQGFFIGETAQALLKNEVLINWLGNAYFGATDNLSINSFLPLNILDKVNVSAKYKFYDSESATFSSGLSYVKHTQENSETINLNIYWDSTSSDTLITHTNVSLGLAKWDRTDETTAFKALGSSSFQTGYELILSNWDRFLIGPSYNFDKKALGGYLSYIWIYDRFHAQLSLNTTNVVQLKVDANDGYYGFFDLYWRF